ncbi:MAG: GNAT family N-acetyltransferase [Flavobacteriaceae bacterium]|jgi:putative acetyltransferase
MKIRPIRPADNLLLAKVLRTVLLEMGVPKIGTAYADPELDCLFETYQKKRTQYFVIEHNHTLLGGAGIAPLPNAPKGVCELQKMYFLPQARGKGWGYQMIETCLQFAHQNNFDQCYIETMPNMKAAQKLYQQIGFDYLDSPLGNTGHFSCSVWMLKPLP